MKKLLKPLLWLTMLTVCVSLVASFSLGGCKPVVEEPVEEPVVEEPVEELVEEPVAEVFDWKKFSGETIKIVFTSHPWQEALEEYLGDFEELTGITLEVAPYLPTMEYRQKRSVDVISGAFDGDVYMLCPVGFAPEYAHEGWAEPLDAYLNDPTLTSPDYDFEDFFASARDFIKADGQSTYTVPITAEAQVLFYRTDLFDAAGLEPPTTMDELYEDAVELTTGDVNGITLRGRIDSNWWPFQGFLASYGGSWIDKDENILINTPESIAAFDMYGKLVKECASGGTADYCFDEIGNEFGTGKAAMYLDASVALPRFSDSEKSVIQENFGTALMPAGPAGSIPDVHYWGIAMYTKSEKKDAAWLFIQWATTKEMQKNLFIKGVPSARASVWDDEEIKAALPVDFVEVLKASLANGQHAPLTPKFAKLQHILTIELQAVITGQKTAEEAANSIAEQWEEIL